MHRGMNASAADFHQTCEMSAKNKDCSCVFNQGKPFVFRTTCGAVASLAPPPPSVVSSEEQPSSFSLKDSSPRETWRLNVPSWRLDFSPRLIMPAIRPVAAHTGYIDYPTRQQQGHERERGGWQKLGQVLLKYQNWDRCQAQSVVSFLYNAEESGPCWCVLCDNPWW